MMAEDFSAHAAKVHVRFPQAMGEVEMQRLIESLLSRITLDCVEQGTRLIGHVKCIAEIEKDRYIACSVVGHDGKAKCSGQFGTSSDHLDLVINVLQYGLTKEQLENIVRARSSEGFGPDAQVVIEDINNGHDHCDEAKPIQLT